MSKLSEEGIALECFNCGAIQYIRFELPEPLPPAGSKTELAVTCGNCSRSQWMTLTLKPRVK
jgi:hypothetical protein